MSGPRYSPDEIRTLRELVDANGGHIDYMDASELEDIYFLRTGIRRASGALYMAAWRDEKGAYEHIN